MSTETHILQSIRLTLGRMPGLRLFRNQSGAFRDATGRMVKFGVASPGGADLLGWKTVRIGPEHLGRDLAVLVALEVKTPTGKATPEQLNFIAQVKAAGGIAAVVRSPDEAARVVGSP